METISSISLLTICNVECSRIFYKVLAGPATLIQYAFLIFVLLHLGVFPIYLCGACPRPVGGGWQRRQVSANGGARAGTGRPILLLLVIQNEGCSGFDWRGWVWRWLHTTHLLCKRNDYGVELRCLCFFFKRISICHFVPQSMVDKC